MNDNPEKLANPAPKAVGPAPVEVDYGGLAAPGAPNADEFEPLSLKADHDKDDSWWEQARAHIYAHRIAGDDEALAIHDIAPGGEAVAKSPIGDVEQGDSWLE